MPHAMVGKEAAISIDVNCIDVNFEVNIQLLIAEHPTYLNPAIDVAFI